MVTVTCPHCDTEFEDSIEDYHEDEKYETECPDCEKVFGYSISIIISTDSFPLPCGGQFGDGTHEWKKIIGYPEEYFRNKYRCVYCDLEKVIEDDSELSDENAERMSEITEENKKIEKED